ncbi:hypothetical protein R3P38DRAFT_2774373 [Favolaschia claudopus]|uniref:Uncharacterized protein n=1 Tax=Favolaschia claudopus TaxID=2862362 RepID=A0AAW0C0H6_9AGAR
MLLTTRCNDPKMGTLTAREARHDQVMKNEEIQNVKQIVGSQHRKDSDGSHIKRLTIDFLDLAFTAFLTVLAARAFCEHPDLTPLIAVLLAYFQLTGRNADEACERTLEHTAINLWWCGGAGAEECDKAAAAAEADALPLRRNITLRPECLPPPPPHFAWGAASFALVASANFALVAFCAVPCNTRLFRHKHVAVHVNQTLSACTKNKDLNVLRSLLPSTIYLLSTTQVSSAIAMDSNNPQPQLYYDPSAPAEGPHYPLDPSLDPSATSGGYNDNTVTSGGPSDNSATAGGWIYPSDPHTGYHDPAVAYNDHSESAAVPVPNSYADSTAVPSGYTDPNAQPSAEALLAANPGLAALLENMRLDFNNRFNAGMEAFRTSVQDDFDAVERQRDAARNENSAMRVEGQRLTEVLEVTNTRLQEYELSAGTSSKPPPSASPNPSSSRTSPKSRPSATPPRSSPNASSSPSDLPKSKAGRGGKQSGKDGVTKPTQENTGKAADAKKGDKKGSPKKLAQYQMLKKDIPRDADSVKAALQLHIRFISGSLVSGQTPLTASPAVVRRFELRFQGTNVTDLKRAGVYEAAVVKPSQVKLGLDVRAAIRSKSKILHAFARVEEKDLLHLKAYISNLGINTWAVDFTQSSYSVYNNAMRECAIDTFRFLASSSAYDFLGINTDYIQNIPLLTQMYDHFLFKYRQQRLGEFKTPLRLRSMFALKATSDDEDTQSGPRARARPERSEAADRVVQGLEKLIIQDLVDDGKKNAARDRRQRRAVPLGKRKVSEFEEIPKGMPLQYYSTDYYNSLSAQAQAKLDAKIIVSFAPDTTDFFSPGGDNALSTAQLTTKYGKAVFGKYEFKEEDDAPESFEADITDVDGEGEGDIIGSQDSEDEEMEADAASVGSFIDDDGAEGLAEDEEEDQDYSETEEDADMQEIFEDSD